MLIVKRFMGQHDMNEVMKLEEMCFPKGGYDGSGVADYGWSVEQYEEIIDDEDLRFYCIWDWEPGSGENRRLVAATFGFVNKGPSKDEFWVQGISVDKSVRRAGLGRMCLTLLEFEARRHGSSAVLSDCSTKNWGCIKLHWNQGYSDIGTTEGYYRNGEPAVHFRKDID